jgi:hypothetical protein
MRLFKQTEAMQIIALKQKIIEIIVPYMIRLCFWDFVKVI